MAFSDLEILGMSYGYTDETVLGGGAIKGKNCTIKSITPITGGNRVTFEWTLDDGTVQTQTMDVMDGAGDPDYPAYMNTEKEAVLARLKTYYGNAKAPVVIGFNTDQHLDPLHPDTYTEEVPALKTLRDITKEYPFTLCVLGGDGSQTKTTIPALQDDVQMLNKALDGADCPVIHLVGNHDGRGNIASITSSQVFFSHTTDAQRDQVVTCIDDSNNCYYDDPRSGVRFIMICDSDLNGYSMNMSKAFLLDALDNIPDGYAALIFSHHPMGNLTDSPSTRVDDWNDPLNWGDDLAPYADKIIACICGHVHCDKSEIKSGILYLSSTCAGIHELNDGSTRTPGTADFTAYDIFVVDRSTYTIHCIRYGNGEDRHVTYHIPAYTNVLPTLEDAEGEVYNDIGYKNGTYLSSTGADKTATATVATMVGATGFIPIDDGDVIRFRNVPINAKRCESVIYRMSVFSASHAHQTTRYIDDWVDVVKGGNNIFKAINVDYTGNITSIELQDDLPVVVKNGYIRLSCGAFDENSVITINEEIPIK